MPFTPAASSLPESALPSSAAGLRPVAIFVVLAGALALVTLKTGWIHAFERGAQPDASRSTAAPVPGFSIVDREGRALALSAECFDVTVSPRALWRTNTPDRLARRIAAIFGEAASAGLGTAWADPLGDPHEVLARCMPRELTSEAPRGRLVPRQPRALAFTDAGAERLRDWIDRGALAEEEPRGPIRGLQVVRLPARVDARTWFTVAMDPVVALSRAARVDRFGTWEGPDGEPRTAAPERYTRALLDDLVSLLGPEVLVARMTEAERKAFLALRAPERVERLRDVVWAELMPARFRVLARGVDPDTAHRLRAMMRDEAISPWQMKLEPRTERRHPTRPGTRPAAPSVSSSVPAVASADDAFTLLGHWGVLDEGRATDRAERDRERRPHVFPWETAADPFAAYRESLVVERRPWSGIELLCQTELENGPWSTLAAPAAVRTYGRRVRHLARDRAKRFEGGVPNYFESLVEASETPRVEVTLDAELQEIMHAELGVLMERHRPALAMGIAVDVESGDVLALDARSLYGYSGYAPLLHEFTPGSTFKAVIMALALDAGHVTPEESLETFAPRGVKVTEGRYSRIIREAQGAPKEPRITAAQGLAHSVNAVLVQVALRFSAAELRGRLVELGYGQTPGAGLGPERDGFLRDLDRGTWSRANTHASVGFGHEVSVTLWQHAAGLATILRGGERRPLRLIRALERDGLRYERPLEDGQRVLSERACADVRAMLAMGAEVGTGHRVAHPELHPEFEWIGSKTGTTEKVETEPCVHLELEALAEAAMGRRTWNKAERKKLLSQPPRHRRPRCYTSSMMAAARGERDGETRQILVLVVADDPTGEDHFGSRVSGRTAVAVLRQAFGLPRAHGDEDEGARAPTERAPARTARTAGPAAGDAGRPRLYRPAPRAGAGADAGGASAVAPASFDAGWLDRARPWDLGDDEAAAPTTSGPDGGNR